MKTLKLAMAQMSMSEQSEENLKKSLRFCDEAKGQNLLFFPEIQCAPFFTQYTKEETKLNVSSYVIDQNGEEISQFKRKAAEHGMYLSPNLYLKQNEKCFDASFWINPQGEVEDVAKMVHIAQAEKFYEQDYYTPSDDGFKVFDTEYGKIGIVICYDRHLPESIRTCTVMGADLILVPTANCKDEPMEMFEWEMRVQAMQNQVFLAMCNRVGTEESMDFAGESLVIHPSGDVLYKADDTEQLILCELRLDEAREWRAKKPYLGSRRPEWYR